MKVKSKSVKRKPINSKRSLKSKLKRGTSKKKIKIKRKNKSKTLKQKGGNTCEELIGQLKTPNTQGKYKNAKNNPFILANLISSIVNKCGEEKKLEVRPLILLDKNMVGKSFNSELPQEYDELLYKIKEYLDKQKPNAEDTDDDHTNEIIFNLKTQWFTENNISKSNQRINPMFRKIMYNILRKLSYDELENLKDEPSGTNIEKYFIKVIGKRLLEDFNSIKTKNGNQTFENMTWRMTGGSDPSASSSNKEENKLKSKMRIMNPMYKIAYHMLHGNIGEQRRLGEGSYSLWLKEINNIYSNNNSRHKNELGLLKDYYEYYTKKQSEVNTPLKLTLNSSSIT